ncbi:MAG: hypothetical protein RIS44_1043 [Pseudomonadota bacterium]
MNQSHQRKAAPIGPERQSGKAKVIRASELAQMGVCEQRVVFEHRYGPRRTNQERQVMLRGQRMHDFYHREALWILQRPSSFSFIWRIAMAVVTWMVRIWKGRAGCAAEHKTREQEKEGC